MKRRNPPEAAPKLLFLIQDKRMPSSRVRVLNLLPELESFGIDSTAVVYPEKLGDRLRLLKTFGGFDIVYLQKRLLNPIEMRLLAYYAKTLIFDFDDAIYYRPDSANKPENSYSRYHKFKSAAKNAHLIIAGNRILSDYAAQFNKNVVVVPSAVETRNVPTRNHQQISDTTVIGWVGGEGNLRHLSLLSGIVKKLSQECKIQLRIISSKALEIPSVDVVHVPWDLQTQEEEIAAFDIGVMPLPKNRYAEGKCGYKALQYMAAGVPPVVSDVGINRDIVSNGESGLVVPSIDDFYYALKNLVGDQKLRASMGLAARETVEKQFSVSVVGKKLGAIFNAVIEGKDVSRPPVEQHV
jgi:glycosyltransferase involved in cell wall biosynthesis